MKKPKYAEFTPMKLPLRVVDLHGHDVLHTETEVNQSIPDEDVLSFAIAEQRAVLTFNRKIFSAPIASAFCTEDGVKALATESRGDVVSFFRSESRIFSGTAFWCDHLFG